MKLSQLFSGEVRTDTASRTSQPTPAQTEQANRQIRSLVPGQTISGEIVSRNGSEVQIRLPEDILLSARVDRNMNIEIGKNMTFEVKNNGSTLMLSPLFTNVATDTNVLKALDMAGLPVNRVSIDMTEQLMAAGMSVNRNSLQQIFREITGFPQAEISDIISLHKLQMPVNEANLNQMVSYRNLNHQLTQGMDTVLEALPEVFDTMTAQGDTAGAVKLYQEVLQLIQENGGMATSEEAAAAIPGQAASDAVSGLPGQNLSGGTAIPEDFPIPGDSLAADESGNPLSGTLSGEIIQKTMAELEAQIPLPADGTSDGNVMLGGEGRMHVLQGENDAAGVQNTAVLPGEGTADAIPQNLRSAVAMDALELTMHLPEERAVALRSEILRFAAGETDAGQFFSVLNTLAETTKFSTESMKLLQKMFSGAKFRTLLSTHLKNNWILRPEEVSSPGKVEEMYHKLERQLKGLGSALENAGQSESTAYRAVTSMSQNIDFLQQLNQLYTYVQLPLRLQQRDTQGELYVYTNKKKLSSPDGTVSALLHLDMANLGPVDVYVSLKGSKANTRFYLRDDEMIDFMAQHMDTLTSRLQKRGYDCSFSMVLREKAENESTKGGLEPVLRQNRGIMLSHYAFDVRT